MEKSIVLLLLLMVCLTLLDPVHSKPQRRNGKSKCGKLLQVRCTFYWVECVWQGAWPVTQICPSFHFDKEGKCKPVDTPKRWIEMCHEKLAKKGKPNLKINQTRVTEFPCYDW